jgi:hypothetical protein
MKVRMALIVEMVRKDRWAARVEESEYGETTVGKNLGVCPTAYEAVCAVEDYARDVRDAISYGSKEWEEQKALDKKQSGEDCRAGYPEKKNSP